MELRYGTPEEAGMAVDRIKRAEEMVAGWVEQGITPSFVMLIARHGIIVSHKAFGKIGPEADAGLLKPDSIFPVASISKALVAACILILVEDGLIDLNRPVAEYLPEFEGTGKREIMLHHLLTHTSGLRDNEIEAYRAEYEDKVEIPEAEPTQHPKINKMLYFIYQAALKREPGKEMCYCNLGYFLLGEVIRRVGGKSLQDFAKERLFNPLGMKDTNFVVPASLKNRIVRRSTELPHGERYSRPEHLEIPSAAGGAYSTAFDLAVYLQMLLNKGQYGPARILSPASVYQMTRDQTPGLSAWYCGRYFAEASWGFSWNVRGERKWDDAGTLRSAKAFSHGGAGGTFIWADPEYDLLGIYFSVLTTGKNGELHLYKDLYSNVITAACN